MVGADKSLRTSANTFDSEKDVIPDPFGWVTVFRVFARFLLFLPALAPLALILFASFWLVSGLLLGVAMISVGLLAVLAAMLAFDCVPDSALRGGPLGVVRRRPAKVTGLAAAKEPGRSPNFDFYLVYAGVFWVVALAIVAVAARLFLV